MRVLHLPVLAALFGMLSPVPAAAIPVLQLDIVGGIYDQSTETTIATSSSFTLTALLLGDTSNPGDTYFISAALLPSQQQTSPSPDLGSVSLNGVSYDVTSDFAYGVPPLEGLLSTWDSGDLAKHGVFPTYFTEFSFTFAGAPTITPAYNTADGSTNTNQFEYYRDFLIDLSALQSGYTLHFDLYNEQLARISSTDIDVNLFAPFSHDAEGCASGADCTPVSVPEPTALTMMILPLTAFVVSRARRRLR